MCIFKGEKRGNNNNKIYSTSVRESVNFSMSKFISEREQKSGQRGEHADAIEFIIEMIIFSQRSFFFLSE